MIIGMPKERKDQETRIVILPDFAKHLVDKGHKVLIETGAGLGSGAADREYLEAGASIVGSPDEIYTGSDFVVKFKDLVPEEFSIPLKEGQIILASFHLGENEKNFPVVNLLKNTKVKALSWELIKTADGKRPVVTYISELAGSMAPFLAFHYMLKPYGGAGISLVGMSGLQRPKITILGGGNAGYAAAKVCRGFDADVTIFEISRARIDFLRNMLPGMGVRLYSREDAESAARESDAFINTIYPDPNATDFIIRRETVRQMKPGSVIIDLVNAKGIETSRYTTISEPSYIEEGVVHVVVDNLPAMLPKTASKILSQTARKYVVAIADFGLAKACETYPELQAALSVIDGRVVHPDIAATHGIAL
ncbi:MAG: hypothetical protein LBO81_05725 [Clostridiales Family XIII bacterium]|jgi:alanine dehydrogenase|nr:hypothetical protein [Clostridiales Family XIII bacterium]